MASTFTSVILTCVTACSLYSSVSGDMSLLSPLIIDANTNSSGDTGSLHIWGGNNTVEISNGNSTAYVSMKTAPSPPVHWTYEKDDIDDSEVTSSDWSKIFPLCSGRRQSPLFIDTKKAYRDPALKSLKLVDYDDTPARDLWSVVNNGHAVQFSGYFRTPPQMQGGDLPGKYIFQQLHFHWGANSTRGSEHVINGKTYPLEVHLLHRRKNDTDEEAQNDDVGLAVIAILFEVTKTREPPNRHMEDIIAAVRNVTVPGVAINATLPYFSLDELMPDNPSYIRYLGSLTTPPCLEVVVWTVMTYPLKITETQLSVFRSLLKALAANTQYRQEGKNSTNSNPARRDLRLLENFRPVQPTYERNVTFYEAHTDKNSVIVPVLGTTSPADANTTMTLPRMRMPVRIDTSTWTWSSITTTPAPPTATAHSRSDSKTTAKVGTRNSGDVPRTSRFVTAVLFTVWLRSL